MDSRGRIAAGVCRAPGFAPGAEERCFHNDEDCVNDEDEGAEGGDVEVVFLGAGPAGVLGVPAGHFRGRRLRVVGKEEVECEDEGKLGRRVPAM